MWCAGTYPAEGSPNAGKTIPLYEYVVDWSTFVPRQQDDLIVQAIATRRRQEIADAHFLQRMGMAASWCLIAPLVFEEQSIGCLIFLSSARTYLTPEEKPLLECVCGCLTEALMDHQTVFEREGREQAFGPVIDLYIRRGFCGKGSRISPERSG